MLQNGSSGNHQISYRKSHQRQSAFSDIHRQHQDHPSAIREEKQPLQNPDDKQKDSLDLPRQLISFLTYIHLFSLKFGSRMQLIALFFFYAMGLTSRLTSSKRLSFCAWNTCIHGTTSKSLGNKLQSTDFLDIINGSEFIILTETC